MGRVSLVVALLVGMSIANANTITVNTMADVVAVDSVCSLREAIQNAKSRADE